MADTDKWAFDPIAYDALIKTLGHNALLGHRYHAHGPDWFELAMPWQEALVGDAATGAFAAGPVIALMDNSAGTSVWRRRGRFAPQVTVDLRVDFMRPGRRGATMIGRSGCSGSAGAITFVHGIGYEDDINDPVCRMAGSFMLLGEEEG